MDADTQSQFASPNYATQQPASVLNNFDFSSIEELDPCLGKVIVMMLS